MTKEEQIWKRVEDKIVELTTALDDAREKLKAGKKYRDFTLGDMMDLLKYYFLVNSEDYEKALKFQESLDTDIRDKIDRKVHNFVEEIVLKKEF